MSNALKKKRVVTKTRWIHLFLGALLVAALMAIGGSAFAFEVKTGDVDTKISWTNTLRYTYGHRVQSQDDVILRSLNFDDGDRNFDKGTVMNRIDLLSELGLTYKKNYGFYVSGAAWFDEAYTRKLDNTSPDTSNYIDANGNHTVGLTSDCKEQNRAKAELLNAFVFGNFELGSVPVNIKIGRSVVYWGEGLLNPIHAISYSQMPLDFGKATPQPGVEVKELFRPLNNIYVTLSPMPNLTLGAQYFLEWEEYLISETGSYFGAYDFALRGGQSLFLAPGFSIPQGGIIEPKSAKDFGLMARWKPEFMNGATFGFYYRNFSDKQPSAGLVLSPMAYYWAYASDVSLYGVSFGQQLGGTSFAMEISYRTGMPLNSSMGVVNTVADLPERGEIFGARGDTWHALANIMIMGGQTPLWSTSTLLAEVDFNRIERVTERPDLYLGIDSYEGLDKPSRDSIEATISFTPTWYQVFAGVDITLPLSFGMGLMGTSGVPNGSCKDAGSWSVGIGLDFFQQYKADLKYVGYFGEVETDPLTGGILTSTGYGFYRDRGFVSLTLKTSF